jgi:hypothetical protein
MRIIFAFALHSGRMVSRPAYPLSPTIIILREFLFTNVRFIPSCILNSSSVRSTGRLLLANSGDARHFLSSGSEVRHNNLYRLSLGLRMQNE